MPHQGEVVKTREGTVRINPETGGRTPVLMHEGQPYEPLPPRNVEPTVDEYENLFVTPDEFENLTAEQKAVIEQKMIAAEADQGVIDRGQAPMDQRSSEEAWAKSERETRGLGDALLSRQMPSQAPVDPETGERRMVTAEEAELSRYLQSLPEITDSAPPLSFEQISALGQPNLNLLGAPPPQTINDPFLGRLNITEGRLMGKNMYEPTYGPSHEEFLKIKKAQELGYAEGTGVKDSKYRLGFDPNVQTRQELEQRQAVEAARQASAAAKVGTDSETAKQQYTAKTVTDAVASIATDPQQSPQGKLAGLLELFQKDSFQRLAGTGLLAAFGSGRAVAEFTEAMDNRAKQAIEEGKLATDRMRAQAEVSAKESQVRTNFIENMTKLEAANPGITQDERFDAMRERHGMVGVDFRQQWWVIDPHTYELVHGEFGSGNGAVASDLAILTQQAEMLKETGKLKAAEIETQLEYIERTFGAIPKKEKERIVAIQMGFQAPDNDKGFSAIISDAGDVLIFNKNTGLYTVSPYAVNQMDPNAGEEEMSASDAKTWAIINTGLNDIRRLKTYAEQKGKLAGLAIDWWDAAEGNVRDNIADKIGRIRSGGAIQVAEMRNFTKQIALNVQMMLMGSPAEVQQALESLEAELLIAGRAMKAGASFSPQAIQARIVGNDEADSPYPGAVQEYLQDPSNNLIRRETP
jgi:hypothetical protein